MPSIALTGLPASGKSSVGRLLAALRGLPFIDLDDSIVREGGMSIEEIFRQEGEEAFRERESKALEAVAKESLSRPLVLALGGGAILRPRNRELLKEYFTTVWLVVEPRIAALRSSGGHRPLLAGGDPELRIEKLLAERERYYAEVADLRIETGAPPARKVAEIIDGKMSRFP